MLKAVFSRFGEEIELTDELWQYDFGQKIQVTGIELPDVCEVHFQYDNLTETKTVTGYKQEDALIIDIPNEALTSRGIIKMYIYLVSSEEGRTVNVAIMHVNRRMKPEGFEVPEDIDLFHHTLLAANEYMQQTKSAKKSAETAANQAEDAKKAAEEAAGSAQASANEAKTSKENAETAVKNAEAFKTETETAKEEAVQAAADATAAKKSAEEARAAAEKAKQDAETLKAAADADKESAETAKTKAEAAQKAAENAETETKKAQTATETARRETETAKTAVETLQSTVAGYADNANVAKESAETARSEAETAKNDAVQAKEAAEKAKSGTAADREVTEAASKAAQVSAVSAEKSAERAETAKEEIQESADQIQKNATEIDSLNEDLGDLLKEIGHTSTNLLKITGYEIITPNIGVSFSLGDDGRIVMSGKATNSNFVIRLNCEEVQLNSGEDYTVNISSQFTNVSTRLMRKISIGGTSAEVSISGKTSVTWTATNSVISYITLTLPSGYSTNYDGYIWLSKGMQATNYEHVGFISEVAKKAELETFKKSVNDNISGFSGELFERCGLIEKKGVFESFSPTTFSSGIDVLNASFEYNRFNNVSKKIIVKPSTPVNYYNIQQAFTFGDFESITVLMYTTVRAFNNKSKLQFYIQLASSKVSNKYGTAMLVDASLLNVGWGAYKIPLSAFTFANGASIDEMDLIRFRLRVLSSSTEDLEIICGGYIYNERMKPTVVMSFDGVYDTDTVIGGKFDALIQNKIHATMFQSVNTIYSDDTKSVFYNHVINDGLEIQMYATANREYVQTEDNPETQYNELRTQKEWLYENRIGGLPTMYAAPNGILPNTTLNLLKSLGFKMSRSGSAYYVNRFTEKDFNVGFKGIFGTNTSDNIKNMIDEAITEGKAIFLFTHEVKSNPASYDSDISNFKSVCDYIGEQITNGKMQSMNFTEFYNACVG